MAKVRAFWLRLLAIFVAARRNSEFDEELQSHIAMDIETGLSAGLSLPEARRRALLRLGGAEQTRQIYRERATLPLLENVLRDIRYALRGFRRNPIFSLTAIATLTLAIGATTAVFSVVDRILFRSLPYAHDDRLVSVGMIAPIIPREFMLGGSYYDWKDNQTPFESLTSETGVNGCDLTDRNPQRLTCANVEANFLPTLGVSPILGRNFLPEEDRPNGPRVALISHGLWHSQFNGDAAILSRLINIDNNPVRVIGVLPKDFEMPALENADLIMPEALDQSAERKADPGHVLYAFARLKPGITIAHAASALKPVFDYSLSLAPARFRNEVHLRVRTIRDRQMQDVRLVAWVLLGAAFAVLLIACSNVASLLLTRTTLRDRELAVRSALGATRGRLICQALVESTVLALLGATGGCVLAEGLLRIFIAVAPSSLPFLAKAQVDMRIVVFTLLLSLTSAVIFGLIPALQRPKAIALAARAPAAGARAVLRRVMVISQIAVSMILLAGAALLARSFSNLQHQSLGLRTQGVLTASIALNRQRYTTAETQMQYFLKAESALRRLPGVSEVALSDSLPPGGNHHEQIYSIILIAGKPPLTGGTGGMVAWRWVTPDYFSALNIPIVRGRAFSGDQRTSNARSIILSSSLAARLFSNENPIGQRIQEHQGAPLYIVQGVAADVKNGGLTGSDEPEYYKLRRSVADDWQSTPSAVFVIKTGSLTKGTSSWVRSLLAEIDPTVPIDIEMLAERVAGMADRPRFETALLSFFATTGLVMAVIGLYGVIAFMAIQRTQEIGVRMALGASRLDVLRLILHEGFVLIASGGIIGLVAALGASRVLKSLLFSVGPHDPITFAAASLLLALVAFLAIIIPACSAMKVNPATALRTE
jgi:putative ABC transport system permease protein